MPGLHDRTSPVRLFLRLVVYATIAMVLVIIVVIGDLVLDKRRLLYTALGRDALVDACRPAVKTKLDAEGFEPDSIDFGEEPDITFSTLTGKTLTDTFTFEDGASRTRVDGIVTCGVKAGAVTVAVRTRSLPMRAS